MTKDLVGSDNMKSMVERDLSNLRGRDDLGKPVSLIQSGIVSPRD